MMIFSRFILLKIYAKDKENEKSKHLLNERNSKSA